MHFLRQDTTVLWKKSPLSNDEAVVPRSQGLDLKEIRCCSWHGTKYQRTSVSLTGWLAFWVALCKPVGFGTSVPSQWSLNKLSHHYGLRRCSGKSECRKCVPTPREILLPPHHDAIRDPNYFYNLSRKQHNHHMFKIDTIPIQYKANTGVLFYKTDMFNFSCLLPFPSKKLLKCWLR